MMNTLCNWIDSTWGRTIVAATLFVTGLGWAGWASGLTDWVGSLGMGMFTVSNVMGVTALVAGGCMLWSCCVGDIVY